MQASQLKHIAIIMDGNGRWAKSRGLPRIEGHRRGVENVRSVLEAMQELGIPYMTLYAFSVENWQRPPNEIKALMGLLEHFLKSHLKDLVQKKIRLNAIGQIEALPKRIQEQLHKATAATQHFDQYTLNVALNYGARTEVIDAIKSYADALLKGATQLEELDYSVFSKHLYTADTPDPDLLIRTSGETRMSNFLLLQCAYSELYFTPVYWPDVDKKALMDAVTTYIQREGRFGKTGEQIQQKQLS